MGQLRALLSLRWRMVRSRRTRVGLLLLAGWFPILLVGSTLAGQSVDSDERLVDMLLLAPTMYLLFAGLAVVAPLVLGGGNELFPDGQLVAFPLTPRTLFQGSLLLAPLNLAWLVQVLLLTGVTAAISKRGLVVMLALVTFLSYVALATVTGQALAWAIVGMRQSTLGRRVTTAAGACLGTAALAMMLSDSTTALLDRSPTRRVLVAAIQGSQGRLRPWATVTLVMVAATVVAYRCGARACGWAVRRSAPVGRPELASVVRRPGRATPLRELVAVDRASVWRSTSLRRGVLVLAVLPGGVAMLADPNWVSLTLLPGLVAAGAGLLFGVNAFCLDGAGAMFVAAQPHPPRTTFTAKVLVICQTCVTAVVLALALALTQVDLLPSAAEAIAVGGSMLGAAVLVAATCARLSVARPHKADLRGPRDTPAPPTTMAIYSARLALGTTWAGLLFAAAAAAQSWEAALAASVAVLALGVRSLLQTFRLWEAPDIRAHVVMTVSYG